MYILGSLAAKAIRTDPSSLEECNRMQSESSLPVRKIVHLQRNSLTISLQNVR